VPLDDREKERIRYHLGYLNVGSAASLQFGLPRPIQTLFIVEEAMIQLLEVGLPRVRRILNILDGIEERLVSAQRRLAAEKLGELTIRYQEPDLLEHEYWRWSSRLANILWVPLYAYADRFRGQGPTTGVIPVRNG
jgi:hypothetical protein